MVIYNDSSDFTEKVKKTQEYIGALEEERRKIQVFERELPLCLDLVSQAIERCRRKMSSEGPFLEEFLPIKRASSINEDDSDDEQKQKQYLCHKSKIICSKDKTSPYSSKSDWLTSAQLSIQVRDPPMEEDFLSKKQLDMEGNKNVSGAFHPFQKKTSASSSADSDSGGGGGSKSEDKIQSNKKERRCWSSDLHRLFLHVLQQLGGAHVATPKQIRELMKVDGLTNDEIKSHLQKYRLHTRRQNPTIHDTHTPQLVVVGRIWMPPLEYASQLTDNTNNAKSVYPLA